MSCLGVSVRLSHCAGCSNRWTARNLLKYNVGVHAVLVWKLSGGGPWTKGDRGALRRGWDGLGKMVAAVVTSVGSEWGAHL